MKVDETAVESVEVCTSADKVCSLDDLLSKILAELPLSSLRLSKSVCKRWFSLISDPTFTRSPNADHPYGLLFQLQSASSEFAYVPLGKKTPLITSSFPFYASNSPYIQVWQSCNGLLLCSDWPDKLYVYNPTINQCKLLPLPHNWKAKRFVKCLPIAFDPAVSPHYKVVYAHEDLTRGRRVHVQVYSSETGNWRACDQTFSLAWFMTFGRKVVYWRGAIHWVSRISVYHFSVQDMDFIQVEDHTSLYGITYGVQDKLFVSRDRLLLSRMLPPPLLQQMNVYEMNNPYYYSGWSLKYHVNFDCVAADFPGPNINVLSVVLGEDSFVVLEVTGIMLIQYNIISKTFHQLCDLSQIRLRETSFCSFFFTPSLVGV